MARKPVHSHLLPSLSRRLLQLAMVTTVSLGGLTALAQPNLRSSFPGRRVGGATRGLCTARLIVHLVPASSVFASGPGRLLGILEGPSSDPTPVQISFRPESGSGETSLTLPASTGAIVLLRQPSVALPSRWTSRYQCDSEPAGSAEDPLSFVKSEAPPALSLLVSDVTPADQQIQNTLNALLKACGSTVSREQFASDFSLSDVLKDSGLPERLPVRCPS